MEISRKKVSEVEYYSNCCGYPEDDIYNRDTGFCGSCKDHCSYEVYCCECSNEITDCSKEVIEEGMCYNCSYIMHKL